MRLNCYWPALLGLMGCLLLSGCSGSNAASEMPTKVTPRPPNGLQVGPVTPDSNQDSSASQGSQVAPEIGSP